MISIEEIIIIFERVDYNENNLYLSKISNGI